MATQTEIETYNHARFVPGTDEKFVRFRSHLPVGSAAPDFAAILLETGETVHLSDYWREQDVVLEFGAIT